MPEKNNPKRPKDWIPSQPMVLALYAVLLVGCVIVSLTAPREGTRDIALLGVVFTFATLPMGLRAAAGADQPSSKESLDRVSRAVERLTHEGGLSETAKRILHRKEERDLLRSAIEQDIQDGDHDAALILAQELADRFGYRADAEEYRARIERVRAQTIDAQVIEALESLDALLRTRHWAEAFNEAARITRLFPESHRVQKLTERCESARARYKQDLERRFLLCAQRDQVDDAMTLLRELDQYLSEAEAEPYREVARGIIGKARDNLGVRFKLALQDRAWGVALDVGERIITDFPNSRMAQEVREMLDTLRERAQTADPGAYAAR